jgi:hypothetical protein
VYRHGSFPGGWEQASSPWSPDGLLRWAGLVAAGIVMVSVGWYLASGEARFGRQMGGVDLAVSGLIVAGVGNIGWLLHGRRSLGERRRAVHGDAIVDEREPRSAPFLGPPAPASAAAPAPVLVAGQGTRMFHRADCVLAAGRDWPTASRRDHEAKGRLPCGVCRA